VTRPPPVPGRRKYRLKLTLPIAVIGLICAAAALVISVNQMNYAQSMKRMADRQMHRVAAETREELERFQRQAAQLTDQAREVIELELRQGADLLSLLLIDNQLNPYFTSVMRQNTRLQSIYVGGQNGEFAMVRRNGSAYHLFLRKTQDAGAISEVYSINAGGDVESPSRVKVLVLI